MDKRPLIRLVHLIVYTFLNPRKSAAGFSWRGRPRPRIPTNTRRMYRQHPCPPAHARARRPRHEKHFNIEMDQMDKKSHRPPCPSRCIYAFESVNIRVNPRPEIHPSAPTTRNAIVDTPRTFEVFVMKIALTLKDLRPPGVSHESQARSSINRCCLSLRNRSVSAGPTASL